MSEISVNVLIVFHSRYGTAERLALAAGVGAIQGRANIRLRRLPDRADQSTIDADPAWRENDERMRRDYVKPGPADPVWADVIVLAAPNGSPGEVEEYLVSLPSVGSMTGKLAAPLVAGDHETTLAPIYAASAQAGLEVVPAPDVSGDATAAARAHGQHIAEIVRGRKGGRPD